MLIRSPSSFFSITNYLRFSLSVSEVIIYIILNSFIQFNKVGLQLLLITILVLIWNLFTISVLWVRFLFLCDRYFLNWFIYNGNLIGLNYLNLVTRRRALINLKLKLVWLLSNYSFLLYFLIRTNHQNRCERTNIFCFLPQIVL